VVIEVNRFSKTIYLVAEGENQIVEIDDSFKSLAQFYRKNGVFRQLLITSRVELGQKVQILQKSLNGLPPLIFVILEILMETRQSNLLPKIAKQFHRIREEKLGLVSAIIVSAVPMEDGLFAKIEENLRIKFGENLKFSRQIESAMLGGLKLRIGNTVVDGSIVNRMNKLRVALSQS